MSAYFIAPLSITGQGAELSSKFSVFAIIGYMLLFFGILALAYFSTRLVGSAYDRSRGESKIRVLDRRLLTQDKSIMVVKVGDFNYVLYSDRTKTLLLDKLEHYEIEAAPSKELNFQAVLNQWVRQKKDSNS